MDAFFLSDDLISQFCEQANAVLTKVRSQSALMLLRNFMFYIRFVLAIFNNRKNSDIKRLCEGSNKKRNL